MVEPHEDRPAGEIDPDWAERERQWQRRLGRLRLGAEPIEVQLARYRRVTLALTVVALIIASMFVALFSAFRRPDLGALVALVLLVPVVGLAWLDFRILEARAMAYLRDRAEHEQRVRIRGGDGTTPA